MFCSKIHDWFDEGQQPNQERIVLWTQNRIVLNSKNAPASWTQYLASSELGHACGSTGIKTSSRMFSLRVATEHTLQKIQRFIGNEGKKRNNTFEIEITKKQEGSKIRLEWPKSARKKIHVRKSSFFFFLSSVFVSFAKRYSEHEIRNSLGARHPIHPSIEGLVSLSCYCCCLIFLVIRSFLPSFLRSLSPD